MKVIAATAAAGAREMQIGDASKLAFTALVLLRALFAFALILLLDNFAPLGTSPVLVGLAAVAGVAAGAALTRTRIKAAGILGIAAITWLVQRTFFAIAYYVPLTADLHALSLFAVQMHFELLLGAALALSVSTWLFFRSRVVVAFEMLTIAGTFVALFAGHRNFRFDTPQILSTIAWELHVSPLTALLGLGACSVVLVFAYLYLAALPGTASSGRPEVLSRARFHTPVFLVCMVTAIGAVFSVTMLLYSHYSLVTASRLANGVGQEQREGLSPLGFHSALGSTNQPAALVRLEGDYNDNPFLPQLYLRESALSQFNGRELVIASGRFDRDAAYEPPQRETMFVEDPALQSRRPLVQSIFLLADHKLPFAIDYPISITPLKNPDPRRFKGAFRAYSQVAAFPLNEVRELEVGDERWDEETWAHYLRKHPDQRYDEIARAAVANGTTPIERAALLALFLNKSAIYTLTPNHEVAPGADPVAPFLFGDRRGYCVHFAHAMVYMLRSLGIPSRIGTGYLTDMSQSKDGHILLRMSDRHAWAEVYIRGRGWLPFDVQPEQVESHADTQVDMGLLEELMSALEHEEQLLPEKIAENEPRLEPERRFEMLPWFAGLLIMLAAGLIAAKFWLRYGWMLYGSGPAALRRQLIAVLSALHDLGYRREHGETREEFRRRVSRELGFDPLELTQHFNRIKYSGQRQLDDAADSCFAACRSRLAEISWKRKIMRAGSPSSAIYSLTGGAW